MHEDWQLDEDFRVESAQDFIDGLDAEERDFLYHRSGMKVCPNCGEFVSRLYDGVCNLCNQSEFHQERRAMNSGNNHEAVSDWLKEIKAFNNRERERD